MCNLHKFERLLTGISGTMLLLLNSQFLFAQVTEGESPDPRVLLIGARQARMSVNSGIEEWDVQAKYLDPSSPIPSLGFRTSVLFHGDQVRISHRPITASPEPGIERSFTTHTVHDGQDFLFNDGQQGAVMDSPTAVSNNYFYDPRTLGATAILFGKLDGLNTLLPRPNETQIDLVGPDIVNGHDCWHVRTLTPTGWQTDYWISDQEGFAIYKVAQTHQNRLSLSEYRNSGPGKYLPNKVVYQAFGENFELKTEVTHQLLEGTYNIPIASDVFTFKEMDLSPGEPIVDNRLAQRIGFWDGTKIVDHWPERKRRIDSLEKSTLQDRTAFRSVVIFANIAVILVLVLVLYLRYRVKVQDPK